MIRANREALKAETAKARAAQLAAQADELRAKAEEPGVAQRKHDELTTKAAQRDQAAADLDDDYSPPPAMDSDLPRHTPPMSEDGTPEPKAQRNFTDPDSRIMVRDGGLIQALNAQLAVDEANQIIVAVAVGNHSRRAVLRADAASCGRQLQRGPRLRPRTPVLVDREHAVGQHMGTDPHIAVGAHHNNGSPVDAQPPLASLRSPERAAMQAKLSSSEGRARYARRKATVEPVIGQIEPAVSSTSRCAACSNPDASGSSSAPPTTS